MRTTGQGLGVQFLKHVERTRLLVHLVDVSDFTGRDPEHDFEVIMDELRQFSDELAQKPMMVVATKIDACQDPSRLAALERKQRSSVPFLRHLKRDRRGHREASFAIGEMLFPANFPPGKPSSRLIERNSSRLRAAVSVRNGLSHSSSMKCGWIPVYIALRGDTANNK